MTHPDPVQRGIRVRKLGGMAIAAPHFYMSVVLTISTVLFVVTLVTEIVAFVHCLIQNSRAFAAVDTFSKGIWLALIGGSALFVLLGTGTAFGALSGVLSLVPIAVALVYLLDVRPALRDATPGHGPG